MSVVFVDKELEEKLKAKNENQKPEPQEDEPFEEKDEDKIVVSKKSNKKK